MRRTSAAISIAALLAVAIAPVAHSAVTPGATCKKLGQTTTQTGMKYTCVKSGKKLIWNKGAAIKKPASTGTTASPASTPSPTPSVAAVTYPKGPTSFDDLVENYEGIAYAAWKKSAEKIAASTKADIRLKMVVGPTTELVYKEPLTAINLVTRLFAGDVQPAEVSYLAFNYEDRDWAMNQMESIIPNSGSRWIKDVACNTKETCWGGGAFSNGAGTYLVVVAVGLKDLNHTSGTLDAHEFTHVVQQMNMKAARPPREFLFDPWPPNWYWEGQAEFSMHASIYHEDFVMYMRERRNTAGGLWNDSKFDTQHVQNFFVFNAPADWQSKYERRRQYDLGAMFVEILVALKGPDSTMQMWKVASSGVKFDVAFEQVYGTPFSKALPIMSKAIALQLGRS